MIPLLWVGLGLAGLAFLQGCGQSTPEQEPPFVPPASDPPPEDPVDEGIAGAPPVASVPPSDGNTVTYYQHIKPILDAKCANLCHTNGPGPIRITNFDEAYLYRGMIQASVASRTMPPWPPSNDCVDGGYVGDRSLSQDQIDTISAWVAGGGLEGDAANEAPPLASEKLALSRVDLSLSMVSPYAPNFSERKDDYRCFVLDWPEPTTKFVTGFNVKPGNLSLVHHVIAYLISPNTASSYPVDPQGYECFGGGPGAVLAPWAPGTQGKDFPQGTGIRVEPGSKVALQVHYHAHHAPAAGTTDLSTMEVSLENTVKEEAENRMLLDRSIHIPDGQVEVTHRFEHGIGENLLLYGALLHMHQLGTETSMTRLSGNQEECVLNIPQWNFHWQDMYFFKNGPKPLAPNDFLGVECHWNNTADFRNQFSPPLPPGDRRFGEGSNDEMCLGIVYLTKASL